MKAMIFAAGLGTRLKPITDSMPKAMVPVCGKPLIQHTIEKLKSNGFDEIIVNVHHFSNQIINFLNENNNFGIRIEVSDETEMLLDTGGGIKKAAHFFDDGKPFLVHNVDILSNMNLRSFCDTHIKSNADATLLTSTRETSRYLLFDKNNRLHGWINKKTGETKSPFANFCASKFTPYAFAGIHIISPKIFKHFDEFPEKFSIIDFYLKIADKENIMAHVNDSLNMIDVGKIDTLSKAEAFASSNL